PVLAPGARSAPPMPPGEPPRGSRRAQLERSRARPPPHTPPGARPVLGRCAPCALPMPPGEPPRGSRRPRLERSHARPPPHTPPGARPVLGRCAPADGRPRGSRGARVPHSPGGGPAAARLGGLFSFGRGAAAGRLLRGG